MKKYSLSFNGHGVESVFVSLNEDSFSFWLQKQNDEDFSIPEYLCNPEDFEDIPEEFNFLIKDDETLDWDDHEGIFCHIHSPDLDSCYIQVEEIKEDEANEEILCEKFQDFIEKNEHVIDGEDRAVEYTEIPDQVMECNSYEKGTIFGSVFEAEDFDLKLLKIFLTEGPNGCIYFNGAAYDGEDLDNTELCTRGKGMDVSVWDK